MNATQTFVDYEQLIEVLGDAVVVADAEGAISLWNAAAEHLFGFTKSEALGQSLDLIIPERLRPRHWAGYNLVMTTGVTKYGHDLLRVPAVHKDGHTLSIAFTVGLLSAPGQEVSAIVAVIRDDTKRFAEERELRKRLAELEEKTNKTGS